MSESSSNIPDVRKLTGMRLMVLFASFFVMLLMTSVISAALTSFSGLQERTGLLLSSAFQCVLAFCIPAYVTARFSSNRPLGFLGIGGHVSVRAFAGVIIVYILALPAMNYIIEWNEGIHFPEWASGLEATLREWENTNGSVADKVLDAHSIAAMLAGVAVVGLLTGFSEEVFFRGAMQTVFKDSGISAGAAVCASAFIFSALHFQFFGFVPRFIMGAFFGYLLIWTGSLWPGVFAHALNNSIVVVEYWIGANNGNGGISYLSKMGDGEMPWGAIMSAAATILFFLRFREYFFKTSAKS